MDFRPTPHKLLLFTIVIGTIVLRAIYLLPVRTFPILTSTTVKIPPAEHRIQLRDIRENMAAIRSLQSFRLKRTNKRDGGEMLPSAPLTGPTWPSKSLKHRKPNSPKRGDGKELLDTSITAPNKRRFTLRYIGKHKDKLPELRSESNRVANNSQNTTEVPPTSVTERCQPKTQIVLVKTHKTASSTMASILQRYGMRRNLNFATPVKGTSFPTSKFKASYVFNYEQVKKHFGGFNMFVCHARYKRTEMDRVVPNATYITLLRNPVDHFISSFVYYNYSSQSNLPFSHESLSQFLTDIEQLPKFRYGHKQMSNGMAQDLGFSSKGITRKHLIRLEKEFNLVLISDYFDESLLLLKKQLCLEMNDILYIPFRKHSEQYNHFYDINDDIRARITELNKVDAQLFQHFNRTFWKRVKQYGPTFKKDLRDLRARLKMLHQECAVGLHKSTDLQGRYINYRTKTNDSEKCRKLFIIDDNNSIESRRSLQFRLESLSKRTNRQHGQGVQNAGRKRYEAVARALSESKKLSNSSIFRLRRVIRNKLKVR